MSFTDLAYGGAQAIQQLLLQRELEKAGVSPIQLAQAKLANEQRIQNRADQEMQLRRLEYEQNQARSAANDQSLAQQRIAGEGERAAETIPGNSILSPTDTGAGKMEAAGLGGLLTRNTTLPSTQMTGTDLGRLTTRSVPSDNQVQSLTKLPTEKQTTTMQAAKDREQAHADAMANAAATRDLTAAAQAGTAGARAETARHNRVTEAQGQERVDKPPAQNDTARMDRSYQQANSSLESLRKPIADQADRIGRLVLTVNQASPQADALIAPELLTVMAGGQGSGLRMNEAEISRIIGGRSNFEALKAALNKWQMDPSKALSVTPAQREQIRALIGGVVQKAQGKLDRINQASHELIDAPDVDTHRRIVSDLRKELDSIGPDTAAPGTKRIVYDSNGNPVQR